MRGPLLALALLALGFPAQGATLIIQNVDGIGEGFNDPTPAAPVGGNTGTTVGSQRLIAFQFAADLWGALLDSDVQIVVEASFDPLDCEPSSGILGAAAPLTVHRDFPQAPHSGTWYVDALASTLAGEDLTPTDAEIVARFQSEVGTPDCLTNLSWYYGLDADVPSGSSSLVITLLHEFGHGLGFLSLVDLESGSLLAGYDDAFTDQIYDLDRALQWDDMLDMQRRLSALNDGRVVWDGVHVEAAMGDVLLNNALLELSWPGGGEDTASAIPALFGPQLDITGVTAILEIALDGSFPMTDACQALENAGQLAGRIALVDRGNCDFTEKVLRCQEAGALAVLVINDEDGAFPMEGIEPAITIPSAMITSAVGNALRATIDEGITCHLFLDEEGYAGGVVGGRVQLYAPSSLVPGSSISHWDVDAAPNLLMEPFLMPDLPVGVDLTVDLLEDLGWPIGAGSPIAVSFFTGRRVAETVELSWRLSNAPEGTELHVHRGPEALRERLTLAPLEATTDGSYVDEAPPEDSVDYWLELSPPDELPSFYGPARVASVAELSVLTLVGALPNPFYGATTLGYQLSEDGPVRLTLHDLRGRAVRTIVDGPGERGPIELPFAALDDEGSPLAAGVYVLRLEASGEVLSKKVVVLH